MVIGLFCCIFFCKLGVGFELKYRCIFGVMGMKILLIIVFVCFGLGIWCGEWGVVVFKRVVIKVFI